MMLNVKAVLQLFLLFLLKLARCDILVYNIDTHELEFEFKDVPSKFGDPVPPDGLTGLVVYSDPEEACSSIQKPPSNQNYTGKWIVLIRRYGCQFEQKIRNAQKAGFDAAIVHNVESSVLKPMAADNPYGIHIPSVFIGSESGFILKNNYLYDKGYLVLIIDDIPFNFTSQLLIIFSVLIGFCFFVMIFFFIVKYFKDRRRRRIFCLPKSCLKEMAIHKFKKNDPYELCAICLEEYVENDKLRVLPCSHAYHSICIDPWLTKRRRVCPVCKRMVFFDGESSVAESDSETEDETAPFVRSSGNTTNAGTFSAPIENPLRRWSSSDSGSGFGSNATTPSSQTNSFHSVPEAPRHCRRAGNAREVRNVPPDYSINSGETRVHLPGRVNRQRSVPRNNSEQC